jgi:hypothetical protein
MARDEKPLDKGRVKVRVIEFELDGSNQTLRDSIRDIVGAIGGRPQLQRQNPAALGGAAKGSGNPAAPIADDADSDVEADETIVDIVASDDEPSRQARRRSPPRTPQIIDLDLTSAKVPLAEFCQKLNPESDNEKYVVIAFWLKHFSVAAEVTMDHIHTCYRHMKWSTPAEAGQPLRNLKARKYGYVNKGSKPGAFVITHIGENHVLGLVKTAGIDL